MKSLTRVAFPVALLIAVSGCAMNQPDRTGEKLTCEQHQKVAVYLNDWAKNNFDETYGKQNDVKGAIAQLFLIEKKAPSPYAQSFNRYQDKAMDNIALSRKKGCDVAAYPYFPVEQFKLGIANLKNAQ